MYVNINTHNDVWSIPSGWIYLTPGLDVHDWLEICGKYMYTSPSLEFAYLDKVAWDRVSSSSLSCPFCPLSGTMACTSCCNKLALTWVEGMDEVESANHAWRDASSNPWESITGTWHGLSNFRAFPRSRLELACHRRVDPSVWLFVSNINCISMPFTPL